METETLRRLRRVEASLYLKNRHQISRAPATLAKLACDGGGPKFQYVGKIPFYTEPELDAYALSILSPLRSSTRDAGEAACSIFSEKPAAATAPCPGERS
jgi:hypothetical protein